MDPHPWFKSAAQAAARATAAWTVTVFVIFAPPASAQTAPPADSEIEAAVLRLFEDDPLLDGHMIGVDAEKGVATLQGLARDLRDRDRAERLASRVRGVRAIINSIKVPPINRSDADIEVDVRDELRSDPLTRSVELAVAAQGGKVTLSGRVDSFAKRKGAYVVASGVRGVLGVDIDNVAVIPINSRPDEELEREIAARLAWNVWTADSDLMVEVEQAIARISGSVPSLWTRDFAADLAAIPGIRRVDSTGIDFLPGSADPMKRARPRAFSDQEIAQAVDRALLYDFEIFASNIEIRVESGMVALTGTVPTLAQRDKAADIAQDTVGVRDVRNEIAIRADSAPSDDRLVQLIKERLARAPAFVDNPPIGVIAQAGVVTLLGTVENLHDKRRAEELAKRQFGVTGVINKLGLSNRT